MEEPSERPRSAARTNGSSRAGLTVSVSWDGWSSSRGSTGPASAPRRPAARRAARARRPDGHARLPALRRRRARRAGPRRPARPPRRPRRLRARRWPCCSPWTVAAPPTGCGRHWPATTSSSSTATSPPTPPTAPRGCTRTPRRVRRLGARAGGGAVRRPRPGPAPAARRAASVAAQRAAHRERTEPGRARDRYESDAAMQDRTAAVYRGLAAAGWLAPWTALDGAAASPPHGGQLRVAYLGGVRYRHWIREPRARRIRCFGGSHGTVGWRVGY